jgi:ArsR family metal-binding transcriptional regulator
MRQSICREYQRLQRREHYERHTEAEKKRTYKVTKDRREKTQKFIYEYLSYQNCKDCGEYDFAVLTFDHLVGKKRMEI